MGEDLGVYRPRPCKVRLDLAFRETDLARRLPGSAVPISLDEIVLSARRKTSIQILQGRSKPGYSVRRTWNNVY